MAWLYPWDSTFTISCWCRFIESNYISDLGGGMIIRFSSLNLFFVIFKHVLTRFFDLCYCFISVFSSINILTAHMNRDMLWLLCYIFTICIDIPHWVINVIACFTNVCWSFIRYIKSFSWFVQIIVS